MHKKWILTALLALPLTVAGLVYGQALTPRQISKAKSVKAATYTCPLTGAQLPCRSCCPLPEQR